MSFMLRQRKATIEGKYAVCANCGQLSSDYNVCEGCSKNLPDKPNYFWPSIAKNPPDEEPSKSFSLADAGTRAGKSQSRISELGKYANCPHCGFLTLDYNVCDCCQRLLPEDIHFWSTDQPKRNIYNKFSWRRRSKTSGNIWRSHIHKKKPYGTKIDCIPHVPLITRPRRKETEDGKFAVCPTCGHLSSDYNVCESCHSEQPIEPNYVWPDWPMIPDGPEPEELEEDEETFVFLDETAVIEVKEEVLVEGKLDCGDYEESCAGGEETRDQFAVCPRCHHLSLDYNICTGCDTPLPKKARYLRPGELLS